MTPPASPLPPLEFKVVIPARLGSTRLPRKVLRPLAGKPLLQWVWQAACASGAGEVVIAADHDEVVQACRAFGADVRLTAASHQSGTDRVDEIARAAGWSEDTLVVNLQGDEPLMPPALVRQAAELLAGDARADIATLCHPLHAREEWLNPSVVKLVMDRDGYALYFSRAPIPWKREGTSAESPLPLGLAFRHIGLYAYRAGALRRYLREMDALPGLPLVASFPIGLARTDGKPGNAVAGFVCPLATDEASPRRRLEVIKAVTTRTKHQLKDLSPAALDQLTLLGMSPLILGQMTGQLSRLPPFFNLVISNVVGSRDKLYFRGAELESIYPISVLFDGYALNATIVGYADSVCIGYTGCRKAVPHLQRLAVYTGEALDELERAFGLGKRPAAKKAATKQAVKKAATNKQRARKKAAESL